MTDRHEQGDAAEAAIEVQGPSGVQSIPMRSNWTLHDVTRIRKLMEAAGYEQVAPTKDPSTGALFAFAPKVEPDELPETPFDTPAQSLCERLSLIPGTRAHSFRETPTGLSGRLTDYGSGRTMDVRLDDVQSELQDVPNEALRRSKERTDAFRLTQHDGSAKPPVAANSWIRYSTRGQEGLRLYCGWAYEVNWKNVTWYRVADEAQPTLREVE